MRTKTMTLSDLFECGIASEIASRDFYLGLAEKFKSRPDISSFWKSLADEEQTHARALEKARNGMSANELETRVDNLMAQKGQDLYKLPIWHTDIVDSIHNLNDAYLLAHELESSDINIVFNFLKLKLISNSKNAAFLSIDIERHLQKLMAFPKMFGDAQIRQCLAVDQ